MEPYLRAAPDHPEAFSWFKKQVFLSKEATGTTSIASWLPLFDLFRWKAELLCPPQSLPLPSGSEAGLVSMNPYPPPLPYP